MTRARSGSRAPVRPFWIDALSRDGKSGSTIELPEGEDSQPAPVVSIDDGAGSAAAAIVREQLRRARQAIEAGKLDDATSCCNKIFSCDPENQEARDLLAWVAHLRTTRKPAASESSAVRKSCAGARPVASGDSPASLLKTDDTASGSLFESRAVKHSALLNLDSILFDPLNEEHDTSRAGTPGEEGAQAGTAAAALELGSLDNSEDPLDLEKFTWPSAVREKMANGDSLGFGGEGAFAGSDRQISGSAIQRILDEARAFLSAGFPEQAIAAASRAQALDPDNHAATSIMEEARADLDKRGRVIEEMMYEAHQCLDRGDLVAAARFLNEVLEQQKDHHEAHDLLREIEKAGAPPNVSPPAPLGEPIGPSIALSPGFRRGRGDVARDDVVTSGAFSASVASGPVSADASAQGGTVTPPIPENAERERKESKQAPARAGGILAPRWNPKQDSQEAGAPRRAPVVANKPGESAASKLSFLLGPKVVLPVLLLVLGGGVWFAYELFFAGGSDAAAASDTADAGKSDLDRLRERKEMAAKAAASKAPAAAGMAAASRFAGMKLKDILFEGRAAYQSNRFQDAKEAFQAALAIESVNVDAKRLLQSTESLLAIEEKYGTRYGEAPRAFVEGHYDDALRLLYRLPEAMQTAEVTRMQRNAWFNIAVEDLQVGNTRSAVGHFDEALALDPRDQQAIDLKKFAQSYEEKAKDQTFLDNANGLVARGFDER